MLSLCELALDGAQDDWRVRAGLLFTQWEDGSVRITGSRVPIDTVIYHFKLGATAEEIG